MKRLFASESLELLLEEIRIRNLLKRVNYGRSYPLTMPGGGNPYAAAIEDLGAPIGALLIVDDIRIPVKVVASVARDKIRPAVKSSDLGGTAFSLSGSLAASGSRKQRQRPIEEIELRVEVPGYRILDSKVSENGAESFSVCEENTFVFRDADTNQCVASDTAKVELRALKDDDSSLLPSRHASERQDIQARGPVSETDRDLIHRILSGSTEAFANLVAKYRPESFERILKTSSKEDIEDIMQETWVAVYQQLGTFEGRSDLSTWIFSIAKKKILGERRSKNALKRDVRRTASLQALASADGPADSYDPVDYRNSQPSDDAERHEEANWILAAIDSLKNERHRTALKLRVIDLMEYEEIAVAMGVPIGSIKGWLNRAKAEVLQVLNTRSETEA